MRAGFKTPVMHEEFDYNIQSPDAALFGGRGSRFSCTRTMRQSQHENEPAGERLPAGGAARGSTT